MTHKTVKFNAMKLALKNKIVKNYLDSMTMNLVHRGQCCRLDKHFNENIDNCNFLSNILNEPKSQSTPLVSRIPKSGNLLAYKSNN